MAWSLPSSNASASASRPWRMRRSARAMSGCQLGMCIAVSKSALARVRTASASRPPAELHEQGGLHAVAVAGEEHRRASGQRDQPVLAEQVASTTPPRSKSAAK